MTTSPASTPITTAQHGPVQQPPVVRTLDLVKVHSTGSTQVRALDGLDLRIERGRFTAIMGASGSGKSTLLHCLAGLDRPTSGQVLLGETDLTALDDRALTLVRRRRIGFVFQAFNLLPQLTAEQNITLPLRLARASADPAWLAAVIDTLRLRERLDHRPGELSGGQQQRVALARSLVTRPDLILADEPTGSLDSHTAAELLAFLRQGVRELGQSVVMVTHDPTAAAYADRVVVLRDGRLVGDVPSPDVDDVITALRDLGR